MQDRYVGDVGDFGKFGLLRALCGESDTSRLKLGVVWYLVPNESHNEDGKHTRYLERSPQFRNCDPELYDNLRQMLLDDRGGVISNRRHLATVEGSGLLPPGTLFFNEPLRYQAGILSKDRMAMRSEWLARALRATANADVVFVDPDNGIECQSVSRTASGGPKYIFWDEIGAFTARGQTVVIYHHLNRTLSSTDQVKLLRLQFGDRMPPGFTTMDVVFKRGTRRAYFITAAAGHRDILNQRLSRMLTTLWANHFIRIV
jgi:hypothetical protein